jgi:hypothetical protein
MTRRYLTHLVFVALSLLLALAFQVIPAITVFVEGIYAKKLQHSVFVESATELVVLLALQLLFLHFKRVFVLTWLLTTFLYLRLHHVLIPALCALIYLEIVVMIGHAFLRLVGLPKREREPGALEAFVAGTIAWVSAALFVSFIGVGSIEELRILTIILAAASLPAWRLRQTLSFGWINGLFCGNYQRRASLSFLALLILAQHAKTNNSPGADSLWYGLRPERVLFGENSFYDNLGLVHPVHYYPKLLEVFLAPLSDLGDYSFILCGNVMLFSLLLFVVYRFALSVSLSSKLALITTCVLGSIPGAANMASSAKPDVASWLFMSLAAYFLWMSLRTPPNSSWLLGLAAISISLSVKLTALFYTPLLAIGYLCATGVLIAARRASTAKELVADLLPATRQYIIVLSLSIFALCGFWARTYSATGYPVMHEVSRPLWSFLGFELKYPYYLQKTGKGDSLIEMGIGRLLEKWSFLLFGQGGDKNVDGNDHWFMLWPGNIVAFLLVLIFLAWSLRIIPRRISRAPLVLMAAPTALGALYFSSIYKNGGDGNYFVFPVIIAALACLQYLAQASSKSRLWLGLPMVIFIPLQFTLMLVSHESWQVGTGRFNFDLTKSFIDSPQYDESTLRRLDAWDIELYFREHAKNRRCIGFVRKRLWRSFSCGYESFEEMSRFHNENIKWPSGKLPPFSNAKAFLEYLDWANIEYIIMPEDGRLPRGKRPALEALRLLGGEELVVVRTPAPKRRLRRSEGRHNTGLLLYDISGVIGE